MTDDDRAIEALRRAIEIAPADLELRRLLAQRLARSGAPEAAIEAFRAALHLAAADPALKLELAAAYLAAGTPGPALVLIEDLIRLGAGSAAVYFLLARARLKSGDPTGATEAYERGYAIDSAAGDPSLASEIGLTPRAVAADELGTNADSFDRQDDSFDTQGRTGAASPTTPEADPLVELPKVTFNDVGGMRDLKEQIQLRIIHPFSHPELFSAYGRKAGGGVLLYGPPGCGKTYLARATAGEIGAAFIAVGIADVLDMWIGSSERNLRNIFSVARAHRPCVLFFDEADALAADRDAFKGSAGRTVINQFLAELDGTTASNENILVLAATNAPWHIDPAFRRPGRFDQVIFVPPPDLEARAEILRLQLKGRPTQNVDVQRLATLTEGYSGADLKGLVDRAIDRKLAEALKDGVPKPITTQNLNDAMKSIVPTPRQWFANVRNYVLYANEAGLYDPVRPYVSR
jgi:transitional endoplasmic reticulum ATPase